MKTAMRHSVEYLKIGETEKALGSAKKGTTLAAKIFYTSGFAQCLRNIGNVYLSMQNPKEYLVNVFNTCKGTDKQVDDVLVIGIKI